MLAITPSLFAFFGYFFCLSSIVIIAVSVLFFALLSWLFCCFSFCCVYFSLTISELRFLPCFNGTRSVNLTVSCSFLQLCFLFVVVAFYCWSCRCCWFFHKLVARTFCCCGTKWQEKGDRGRVLPCPIVPCPSWLPAVLRWRQIVCNMQTEGPQIGRHGQRERAPYQIHWNRCQDRRRNHLRQRPNSSSSSRLSKHAGSPQDWRRGKQAVSQ